MMPTIQEVTGFIHANAALAGPVSLVVAFFGCLTGTNLVVPAGAMVTAMGVLVGAGVISWTFAPWAMAGAALGMSLSYWLGLRFGPRIEALPLLRKRSGLIGRARALFMRYGFLAIFIAYFSGPLRAPMASVAAMAGMPRRRFELANVVSAVVWTISAAAIGAIPGMLIEADSAWLPIGLILVPAITVAISAAIVSLRPRAKL
jgi:membrane protein DedA with SNARE-associated domain